MTRRGTCVPWGASAAEELTAFVLLPHCMQTASKFWERLGFEIGRRVDAKEHKHAVLHSMSDLAVREPLRWSFTSREP